MIFILTVIILSCAGIVPIKEQEGSQVWRQDAGSRGIGRV